MAAIVTYNAKLRSTTEQVKRFEAVLAQAREAFNLCSDIVAKEKLAYSRVVIHNSCYDILRNNFSLLNAQQVIRVQCEVCSAYKSRRSNKHHGGIPKKHSLSMTLDKRLYSKLTKDSVYLMGSEKGHRERYEFIPYDKLSFMFANYIAKDPTVSIKNGELFLSIPFEVPERPLQGDTCVGVDLGMKRLFVTSEGISFVDKTYLKERRKLRYLKRCLQSKGTSGARRHLKAIRHKEHNQSRDMVERSTNALLSSTKASVLVLEDLSEIKEKTSKTKEGFKRKRHNNAMSQVPFYLFKERLTHKAQLAGRRVETVSPSWTSQTDSRTNKRDGKRQGCRYYCSDGIVLDADWNAAVNIAHRSNHPSTNNATPSDGMLRFLDGRVLSTTQSYVSHGLHRAVQAPSFREG